MALLEVLGTGTPVFAAYGSSPPAAPAGPFFLQFGVALTAFSGGFSPAIYFPATFRFGVLAVIAELVYPVPSQLQVTISGVTNEFFSLCAHADSSVWDTGTSDVSVAWEAWGW